MPLPEASTSRTVEYIGSLQVYLAASATDSFYVLKESAPTVSLGKDTALCNGDTLIVFATGSGSFFQWQDGSAGNSLAITKGGVYSVAASNVQGCIAKDTILISTMVSPVLSGLEDKSICVNDKTQLSASGANTYIWFPAAGLSNATIPNPDASPSQTTMYHVKGTGDNGCVKEDSVLIAVTATPQFAINPASSQVCTGDSVLVTASGGDVYSWVASPDVLQPNSSSSYIKPVADGIYKVVVVNNTCNTKDTLFTTVSMASKPVLQVSHSNDIDCTANVATLTATGASRYEWIPAATLTNPGSSTPLAMPGQTTIYHVKATGANGCIAEDSVKVEVNVANAGKGFLMASAFTPNHDGINDCFGVNKWSLVSNLDFSIYNRWGGLMFHSNTISDCWDGTYNGLPQATGAYIYVIRAATSCGLVYRKGTVALIR